MMMIFLIISYLKLPATNDHEHWLFFLYSLLGNPGFLWEIMRWQVELCVSLRWREVHHHRHRLTIWHSFLWCLFGHKYFPSVPLPQISMWLVLKKRLTWFYLCNRVFSVYQNSYLSIFLSKTSTCSLSFYCISLPFRPFLFLRLAHSCLGLEL